MSIHVTVVFHGLCAFIPDKPFGDLANPPKTVWALMPEFRAGGKIGDATIDKHEPVLLAENPILGLPGTGRSKISLHGLDLRFASHPRTELVIEDDYSRTNPNAIQWVADAEDIGPGTFAKAEPTLLNDEQPDSTRLAARLKICSGVLGSWLTDYQRRLKIRNRKTIPRRAYAAWVALQFRESTSLALFGRPFGGSERQLLDIRETCEVHIGNMCSDELDHLVAGKPWHPQDPADMDFAGHFLLSIAHPIKPGERMPYPVDGFGGGGVKCRKILMGL